MDRVNSRDLLPNIPSPLAEASAVLLEWPRLREHIADGAVSPLGRNWTLALVPSYDRAWIEQQQERTTEFRRLLQAGGDFDFRGLFDPTKLLQVARIDGSALGPLDIREILVVLERLAAWKELIDPDPAVSRPEWPAIEALSRTFTRHDLSGILRLLRGKIEPDGSLNDEASPELRRIRASIERQHRAIEESLRRSLRHLVEDRNTQEDLITARGERFVIPVKAEFRRRVPGVIHGSSSSGQTVFIEPLETIELNNELVRLLDDEQSEIHRLLLAMTRAVGEHADEIHLGVTILAEVESHAARARFAQSLGCIQPVFTAHHPELSLTAARHPLLELRMRASNAMSSSALPLSLVPLTIVLPSTTRQLIISGPNTGGKTISLKTIGLLAIMAQAGVQIPAETARLPIFTGVFADIGDAQSIERNLSSFSAHILNLNSITSKVTRDSLVLLDELGSATDPEEGAALGVAIASHFLSAGCWNCITTHLTSLKIHAATHDGVLNASVGFDQQTLSPTFELKLGIPGASAGLNIAQRLGLDETIVAAARGQMSKQSADLELFLMQLHEQIAAMAVDRDALYRERQELAGERSRLELEGRSQQKQLTRELEAKLHSLLTDFELQLRQTLKTADDKATTARITLEATKRMTGFRREFSEQFRSAVTVHNSGADKIKPSDESKVSEQITFGDLVHLRSLGREARISRVIGNERFEITFGNMKMRVSREEISKVVSTSNIEEEKIQHKRGRPLDRAADPDPVLTEINVIGRTADEAESEVGRFIDHAVLAGLTHVRIVHGVGLGVLRRTLRSSLRIHPQVLEISEPPQNEGGQGVTLLELRQ